MITYSKLLFVIDRSLSELGALKQILELPGGGTRFLTVLDVIESLPPSKRMLVTVVPPDSLKRNVLDERRARLETLVSIVGHGAQNVKTISRFGNRSMEILKEVEENNYDLVAKMPDKGRTDGYLIKHCKCKVWVFEPGDINHGTLFDSELGRTTRDTNWALSQAG